MGLMPAALADVAAAGYHRSGRHHRLGSFPGGKGLYFSTSKEWSRVSSSRTLHDLIIHLSPDSYKNWHACLLSGEQQRSGSLFSCDAVFQFMFCCLISNKVVFFST
jgi:hypothetical protein